MVRRFDSRPSRGVFAYRRMMPFLMRGRNESAVYFEQTVDLSETLPWIDAFNAEHDEHITVFHVLLASLVRVLHERPRLNRFVAGRRLHDRDGIWISFAAKKRFDDDAPLSVVKRRFDPDESFAALVGSLSSQVSEARTDNKSSVDKELDVLLRMPRVLIEAATRLLTTLDFFNLAPRALLENHPMYTSVFIANLGSIKLDAAYHHLYEYGNCPLFVTVGRIEQAAVVTDNGAVEARPVVKLKFTYDERVADGLYAGKALSLLERYIAAPGEWL